ncbi:MAG: hypothetical protein EOP49_04065 [Sphingobacteriales bacterium]|nr:MAG: hypothetical protein EOP49_04065 [Sphingobacteriales bacterium]
MELQQRISTYPAHTQRNVFVTTGRVKENKRSSFRELCQMALTALLLKTYMSMSQLWVLANKLSKSK